MIFKTFYRKIIFLTVFMFKTRLIVIVVFLLEDNYDVSDNSSHPYCKVYIFQISYNDVTGLFIPFRMSLILVLIVTASHYVVMSLSSAFYFHQFCL